MSIRRSRFELYIDILNEIKNGSKKPTQIMYGANLSWKPLQEMLESLVKQELIDEVGGLRKDKRTKKRYELTSKGVNVLRYYSKARSLLEISSGGKPRI